MLHICIAAAGLFRALYVRHQFEVWQASRGRNPGRIHRLGRCDVPLFLEYRGSCACMCDSRWLAVCASVVVETYRRGGQLHVVLLGLANCDLCRRD